MGRKEKTDGEERRRESEEIFKRSPEGEDHISSEEENLPARGSSYRVSICTALSSAGPSDLGKSVPEKVSPAIPSIHLESGQGASKETKFKPAAMTSLVKETSQRRSKLKRRERTDGADLKRVCRREGIFNDLAERDDQIGSKELVNKENMSTRCPPHGVTISPALGLNNDLGTTSPIPPIPTPNENLEDLTEKNPTSDLITFIKEDKEPLIKKELAPQDLDQDLEEAWREEVRQQEKKHTEEIKLYKKRLQTKDLELKRVKVHMRKKEAEWRRQVDAQEKDIRILNDDLEQQAQTIKRYQAYIESGQQLLEVCAKPKEEYVENFYPDGDKSANVKKEEKGEEGSSTNKDEN